MNDTVHRLLSYARGLLAEPGQWAQGVYALDANGQRVDPLSGWAHSRNSFGALLAAYVEVTGHPATRAKRLITRHHLSSQTPLGRALRVLGPLATGVQLERTELSACDLSDEPVPIDEEDGYAGALWARILWAWEEQPERDHAADILAAFDAAVEAASLDAAFAA
jgi:hypothetical protein